ncbi:hypothetical protein FNH05_14110 [Amycolatopsis rhizosphaerae]|uniref:Uncharacterized protein n=1 Tax=Amycolatopsis rhizosphaerae TaxID=2053003 RepID=A0A558CSV5_9PSEU|nr:hypothetical protein [Amycolatopsis rhizosphaerae]TVT51823.1 hypothetical protein FNH05_14110 [Amycolatopsis rhizosphaerae]
MSEVSIQELSMQDAELLTAREALGTWGLRRHGAGHATINAFNQAVAIGGRCGDAFANANQTIVQLQGADGFGRGDFFD